MGTEVIYPRVEFGDQTGKQLYPPSKHPVGAAVFACAFFAVALYLAVTDDDKVMKPIWATWALMTLVLTVAIWRYLTVDRHGHVRVRARSEQVRFIAPSWVRLLLVAAYASSVVPGVLWWWLVANGLAGNLFRSGALLGIGILGVVGLAGELIKLPHPSGLTLSPHDLRGVRGARRLNLAWDDLAGVEVVYAPRGAKLLFKRADRTKDVLIDSRALASDPRIVAMIVEHYRTHPGDRAELADAEATLSRIRESRF